VKNYRSERSSIEVTAALFVLALTQAPIVAQTRLFVAMGLAEPQGCGPDGCPTGRIIELDVDNVRVLADTPVPLATRNSWRQLQITADARYLLWTGNDGSSVGGMALFDTLSRIASVARPILPGCISEQELLELLTYVRSSPRKPPIPDGPDGTSHVEGPDQIDGHLPVVQLVRVDRHRGGPARG
jgi:hypothetical protein